MSTLEKFQKELGCPAINLSTLRALSRCGCPDMDGIRSTVWKILLHYLPLDKAAWSSKLSKSRKEYAAFAIEFLGNQGGNDQIVDDPLSCQPRSAWKDYYCDNEVLLQINKDCRRLCPELDFFRRATAYPGHVNISSTISISSLRERVSVELIRSQAVAKDITGVTKFVKLDCCVPLNNRDLLARATDLVPRNNVDTETSGIQENEEAQWEVVQRILFLYYKANHSQPYVQGMNEIIGPLYYVFAKDPNIEWRRNAEADTFFCFHNLMTDIQSSLFHSADRDANIGGRMEDMFSLLGKLDPQLCQYLKSINLLPAHFAFRWMTVLLSREFLLPDVLRLWDSVFAYKYPFDFVRFVCCAMLILNRNELLSCDFAGAVILLQNYPCDDVGIVLSKATALYNQNLKFTMQSAEDLPSM